MKATIQGFLRELSRLTPVDQESLSKAGRSNITSNNNKAFRVLCDQFLKGSWDDDLKGLIKEVESLLPKREILTNRK